MRKIELMQFTDYIYGAVPLYNLVQVEEEDEIEFETTIENDDGEEETEYINREGFILKGPTRRHRVAKEEAKYKKLTIKIGE